jgi:hypothetical protein
MASKPTFDLVVLRIGYKEYAVPKAAALQFMDLCAGSDVYEWGQHWKGNGEGSEEHAWLLESTAMPSVTLLGPVQFHQAVENRKMFIEAQAAKKAKND